MEFPEWAPKKLTEHYTQDKAQHELSSSEEEMQSAHEWYKQVKMCTNALEEGIQREGERLEILGRLLTSPHMKEAWLSLARAHPVCNPNLHEQLPWQLWYHLWNSVEKFQRSEITTASEKKKRLTKLARTARDLAVEIQSEQMARTVAANAVEMEMCIQDIQQRYKRGEKVFPSERIMPVGVALDLIHAAKRGHAFSEKPFKKQSLYSRLTFWVQTAKDISLTKLLERFAEAMEAQAEEPPLAKQPARGEAALKAYLVRELHGVMMWMYGKPLDDTVARIVNTTLDLWNSENPLDRRSVRDYTKP